MRITLKELKRIIKEEVAKAEKGGGISKEVDVEEVDADEFADSLENKVDFVKLLKLKEARLQRAKRTSRMR